VLSVTTFDTDQQALQFGDDTLIRRKRRSVLQAIRGRPRKPRDDAQTLSADAIAFVPG
jgi:hypothetical protein